jgi:hypothetical protein
MQIFKALIAHILKKPSLYLFVFLIIFSVDHCNRWVNFEKENPFVHDVSQYYAYLPVIFIDHSFNFAASKHFYTTEAENGNGIPKYTYGMAVMYSPFFLIGHAIAKGNGYKADGYSLPYKWSIHFGSFMFSFLGLWFCRKNLLKFFNEYVTLLTLICIYFGTNFFYYTNTIGEMPHSYLLFIFSVFIYFTIKWVMQKNFKYLFALSFLAGFATLIRPTECVILLFPLLINIKCIDDLKERFRLLFSYKLKLFIAALVFILPFFTQMLYWKMNADTWLFFSYGKEKFFFNDPQIINFLFSFRKGWLIYTPMMIFSIIGLFFLKQRTPGLFFFSPLYFIVNIYILSSWWDWSFGGSFGCRPLIQHYAFFSFPFAAFISWYFDIFKTKKILALTSKLVLLSVFYFLIDLNIKQSWLCKYGLIPAEGLTKEAYIYLFKKQYSESTDSIDISKLKQINNVNFKPDEMIKGNRD